MTIISIGVKSETFKTNTSGSAATKTFSVVADAPITAFAAKTASMASGEKIPEISDGHPEMGSCRVREIAPKHDTEDDKVGLRWQVVVTYATGSYRQRTPTEEEDNPLDDKIQITWGGSSQGTCILEHNVTATSDFDAGAPIVNTATDPFDPPVEVEDSAIEFVLVRPIGKPGSGASRVHDVDDMDFKNTINDSAVTIDGKSFAKHRCRCVNIQHASSYRNDVDYFVETITIHIKRNGTLWEQSPLNRGLRERKKIGADPTPVKNKATGENETVPVLLDADGVQLASDADAIYLTACGYIEKDFDDLELNPTI